MKNLFACLLLLLTLGACTQPKDETAIRQLLEEQTQAWNRGDIDGFMKGYWQNDSLMFTGKSGITYGWNNTLKNYKKSYPDAAAMGRLQFTLLSLKKLSSEYYFVAGKWHLQRTMGDLEGHFTLLLRKIKKKWVIIADHSS